MLTTVKGEIKIVRYFNTSNILMDRSFRQKINKGIQALNDILNQIDLIDI